MNPSGLSGATRRRCHRGRGVMRNRADLMPRLFHQILQVDGDEHLIFDDQDVCPHFSGACRGNVT